MNYDDYLEQQIPDFADGKITVEIGKDVPLKLGDRVVCGRDVTVVFRKDYGPLQVTIDVVPDAPTKGPYYVTAVPARGQV